MGPANDGERARIEQVFSSYRRDSRRKRAWSANNPGNAAIRDEVARATLALLAEHDPGGLLLDAGCGSGWWLERLRATGVATERLVGVELQPARAAAAQASVPDATVHCADIRALPVASASCALVTLFTVLSGMRSAQDVDAALSEVRRVLAPGGAVAIWEPRVPTLNPDTRLIQLRVLRRALGPGVRARSITLAPPIARRVGSGYRTLNAFAPLRTHRFVTARLTPGPPG